MLQPKTRHKKIYTEGQLALVILVLLLHFASVIFVTQGLSNIAGQMFSYVKYKLYNAIFIGV